MKSPVLIYDGACTFCQMSVIQIAAWTGPTVDFVTSQAAVERFPEIPKENFDIAVQFVERGGEVSGGEAAVFQALACVPSLRWPLWLYRNVPGLATVLAFFYSIVARNRMYVSKAVLLLVGSDVRPARYTIAGDLFPRLLGLVYFCAILSLWTQWDGLYGARGLLPLQDYLQILGEQFQQEKYRVAFSIFWLDASPGFVNFVFGLALSASVLAMAGILPLPALTICWAAYLSFCSVGQDFMSFQWDALLLETGFLAIFCVPWVLRLTREKSSEAMPRARHAVWFLLFKLMFMSGVVKLASGDTSWRKLSALQFHFYTQPLPTWVGWFAHQLPAIVLTVFCMVLFFIELVVPFLIFLPRRVRRLGFLFLVLLQLGIAATGNYGFFNLLTLTLCVTLLDDVAFPRFIRKFYRIADPPLQPPIEKTACVHGCALPGVRIPRIESVWSVRPLARQWPRLIAGPILLFVIGCSAALMAIRFELLSSNNVVARVLLEGIDPLRSVSTYGLFQVMTTERDEIVIEGSNDGTHWLAYEMKYKPGNPQRRPAFIEPHMPRLDWQMWFAALGTWRNNPWFPELMKRLFEGSPDVLALFAQNPFPDGPPKHLRARIYRYEFSTFGAKEWWVRRERGIYFPQVTRPDVPTTP